MSSEHQLYWNSFYGDRVSAQVPTAPSAFAKWVSDLVRPPESIAEFGFGNARDSLWFAAGGYTVLGFDFADSAVAAATVRASEAPGDATFKKLDLYDGDAVAGVQNHLSELHVKVIYGRFLIHSLEAHGRAALLDLAAVVLRPGGSLYLEFRTGQDASTAHAFGEDHFRTYVDPDLVVAEVEERGGAVTHLATGTGMAVYKTEDPHVARLVARW